ncbi:hypothetical protein ACFLS1_03440, partial [Verrucomicrobiota bacterium]
LTMFPVVGPVKNFRIVTGDKVYALDQHGVSRYLPYRIEKLAGNTISFAQNHDGIERIKNRKFGPGKDNPEYLVWPFGCFIRKEFELNKDRLDLKITVTNREKEIMPYMLGWHPAFRMQGAPDKAVFEAGDREYSLDDIIEVKTLILPGVGSAVYRDRESGHGIEVSSVGFDNIMIWTPARNAGMFCIEPVTHEPCLSVDHDYFTSDRFHKLGFEETAEYAVSIKPVVG